jgi:ERF superfamily
MGTEEQMTEHASLAAALCAAQAEMHNATLNKVNPHFKNQYADLAAIRDATIPALTKHGLSISQEMDMDEVFGFHLRTVLRHDKTDEKGISRYPLPTALDKPQVMGSAITYARRYSWSAIVGIASEEDDDAEQGTTSKTKSAYQARLDGFYPKAEEAIRSQPSLTALKSWWVAHYDEIQKLPPHWIVKLEEEKDRRKLELADEIGEGPASSERLRASLVLSEEEKAEIDPPDVTTDDPKAFLDDLAGTLAGAKDMSDLMEVWQEYDGIKGVLPPEHQAQAQMIYEQNYRRLKADEAVKLMKEGKKK